MPWQTKPQCRGVQPSSQDKKVSCTLKAPGIVPKLIFSSCRSQNLVPLKMQGAGLAPLISIAHFLPPRKHASLPNHCMPGKSPDLRRTETTSFFHAPHQAHHTLQTESATEVQERRFTAYSSCSKFSSVLSPSPAAFPSIIA